MLPIAIIAVVLLTRSSHAGYIYPRPNIAFELPKIKSSTEDGFRQKTLQGNTVQRSYASVSYSVPYRDYYYVHQNEAPAATPTVPAIVPANSLAPSASVSNLLTNNLPSNRVTVNLPTYNTVSVLNQQNDLKVNSLPQVKVPPVITPPLDLHIPIKKQNILTANLQQDILHVELPNINVLSNNLPSTNVPAEPFTSTNQQSFLEFNNSPIINSPSIINQQSSFHDNTVHYEVNALSVNSPAPISQEESSLNLNTEQELINQDFNSVSNIQQNVVSPIITKDIYFHVPPPEIEETPVRDVTPKKKIYKIIFIKVPSQERRNIGQSLGNAYSQGAQIEDKTIIYVLSKKAEEPQQVFLPKSVPSQHEVLFVKYSGKAEDTVAQISDGLERSEQPDSELIPTQTLEPGLVNGIR